MSRTLLSNDATICDCADCNDWVDRELQEPDIPSALELCTKCEQPAHCAVPSVGWHKCQCVECEIERGGHMPR